MKSNLNTFQILAGGFYLDDPHIFGINNCTVYGIFAVIISLL